MGSIGLSKGEFAAATPIETYQRVCSSEHRDRVFRLLREMIEESVDSLAVTPWPRVKIPVPPPPRPDSGVEAFLELWWEKWHGEEKYVDELEELYSASPATFELRKSTQRGRQSQIGMLLTRLSGTTIGHFYLFKVGNRDRKGRQQYGLSKVLIHSDS
jgi:hypothetical protein